MRVHLMVFCLISYTVNGQIEYSISEETERGVSVGNIAKDLEIDATTLSLRKFRMLTSSKRTPPAAAAVQGAAQWMSMTSIASTCACSQDLI
ncbi:protocadherin alpha-C1-like [Malaclemys terrapin pileata]|uniref:protocadherin alpha-C1-like n=1 Tax=Malaclemys terrapin pileata TaxID=2991368 RepID=UPI0023A89813|nr:protocadherin alpha-C1-like [Malaclemys terrapin pileata]